MSDKNKEKMLIQAPKGMHDIFGEDYELYQEVHETAKEIAEYYGLRPIQTPHLEKTDVFTASLGATSDIVEKEMYTLKTRGGDSLTLRPEGTASVMRAYIEHGMQSLPQPVSFWYGGSFFRHDNPQRGRYRELQQFGMEIIGEPRSLAEATVIQILYSVLEELGIKNPVVNINSIGDKECRSIHRRELLNYYKKKEKNLCKDCKRRFKENPLRLLDCKDPGCVELRKEAPTTMDHLCQNCKEHFKTVLESLEFNGIPYVLNGHLVRGLDYYSRTVFEIFENRPATENEPLLSLAGGGRYDYLGKILGKKEVAAAGGGLGVDRVVQAMKANNVEKKRRKIPKLFLIQLGMSAKYRSLKIIEMLRKAHIPIMQSISKDSIKGQLNLAAKLEIPHVLILGQEEVIENSIIIRNMETRSQETVPMDKLVETLKKKV